jgi:hypothetical protein
MMLPQQHKLFIQFQILLSKYNLFQEVEKEIADLADRRLQEETTCTLAVGLFDTARNQRVQVYRFSEYNCKEGIIGSKGTGTRPLRNRQC